MLSSHLHQGIEVGIKTRQQRSAHGLGFGQELGVAGEAAGPVMRCASLLWARVLAGGEEQSTSMTWARTRRRGQKNTNSMSSTHGQGS